MNQRSTKMFINNQRSAANKIVLLVSLISALHLQTNSASHLQAQLHSFSQDHNQQAPQITPFAFNQNVQENQRSSVLCTISSGDLPVSINWLKDGQLLTPQVATNRKIIIKPDSDQSTLKFASVRLDHAGNYTCVAKNKAGIQAHSAQLIVHSEPHWIKEPPTEPIVASRGQTIVIDCQTSGWPKPQQSWQIKSK